MFWLLRLSSKGSLVQIKLSSESGLSLSNVLLLFVSGDICDCVG